MSKREPKTLVDDKGRELTSFREAYTDRFVSAALVLLESNKGNVTRTARQLCMPKSTLSEWRDGKRRKKHGRLSRDAIKSELIDLFGAGAVDLYRQGMDDSEKMSPMQAITAAAISVDKLQILTGGATSNVNVRVLVEMKEVATPWVEGEVVEVVDD